MTSSVFPDLNVWMALTLRIHDHHKVAWRWYRSLRADQELVFCRFTQMGFLRLITTEAVAKHETLSQVKAWRAYDRWLTEGGALFVEEPFGMEVDFRAFTDRSVPAPKEWADSYLAAFAASASMELVTFDRALAKRARRANLLEANV
jgi:toxin-antitoxin system PIN domain toxin